MTDVFDIFNHQTICIVISHSPCLDSFWTVWLTGAGHQVVFISNVVSPAVEHAQVKETGLQCAVIIYAVQPWRESLVPLVCFEKKFYTVHSWMTTLGGPWARRSRTQNDRMAQIFIILSWGLLGIFTVFSCTQSKVVDKRLSDVGLKKMMGYCNESKPLLVRCTELENLFIPAWPLFIIRFVSI